MRPLTVVEQKLEHIRIDIDRLLRREFTMQDVLGAINTGRVLLEDQVLKNNHEIDSSISLVVVALEEI